MLDSLRLSESAQLTIQIGTKTPSYSSARPVGLFEATAPLPWIDCIVLIQIAGVDERFDAAFVLVMFQIVQFLRGQFAIVVQIQMAKHPAGFQFARGREVDLVFLLLVLAAFLAVGHDDREPIQ